ncbi:electron transport complex subunit RsxC [Jeotgalibaca sp. A127]|uniref:electron transport complex subunit RsxC n=1 Tax=Jeotgalibaca sp. A127 TaxID=3457324 RepID=UPI003FCF39D2
MKIHFSFMRKQAGIFPEERKKTTENKPIEKAKVPEILIFPLAMHIGKPAEPIVEIGDKVKIGTLLAKAQDGISAHVISSVSGEVVAISTRETMRGPGECIIIKNDYQDAREEAINVSQDELTTEDKLSIIQKAGIVGMGGATFPTHFKAKPNKTKPIDTIIINGAECEIYSTSDHRLMIEHAEGIVEGAKIVQDIMSAKNVFIALEADTPDCETALIEKMKKYPHMTLIVLPTMYPQGAEKVLIENITGREVPSGGLPADVRTFVTNVATTNAIYEAVHLGKPLTERITTVTGHSLQIPKNLRVRIGTPINALIEECGGFISQPGKMLHGGPMMGIALKSAEVPITKGSSVITFLEPEEAIRENQTDCIRCSECLNVCPVSLQPILINNAFERGDIEEAERLGAMDCIECGNCSFICPSKIPLLDNIRSAKIAIKARNTG